MMVRVMSYASIVSIFPSLSILPASPLLPLPLPLALYTIQSHEIITDDFGECWS